MDALLKAKGRKETTAAGAAVVVTVGQHLPGLAKLATATVTTITPSSSTTTTPPRASASPPPPSTPPHPILILAPPACLGHDIPGHFERPARVTAILDALQQHAPPLSLQPSSSSSSSSSSVFPPPLLPPSAFLLSNDDSPLATREQLGRFHTQKHIDTLFSLFARSKAAAAEGEDDNEDGGKKGGKEGGRSRRQSDRVRLNNYNKNAIIDIDGDTSVCPGTEEAALRAAGAACRGVDEVLEGGAETVFCVVRPPGHHATPDRAMGFCVFNNVGVAAMHARAKHGVRRVAILDPDVHHGNGTQDFTVLDNDLFYASTHIGYGFYPGTGHKEEEEGREDRLVNVPLREGEGSSERFRQAWKEEIFPKLVKFEPSLIILSSGFDAASEDPLGEMELEAEDFWWLAKSVRQVARGGKGGREGGREGGGCKVISVLEGGYHLGALGVCGLAHVKGLLGLPFGEGGGEEPLEALHLLPPVTNREEEELSEKLAEMKLEGWEEGGKGGK